MSVFTNPASGSREHAEAYRQAILGLLGEGDPREVLEAAPHALREALGGMSEQEMAIPEAPEKWSVRHVLGHLADSEHAWAWRLRKVLAEDRPTLEGYDQDAWAQRLGYADREPEESLSEFEAVRRSNLRLLSRTGPEDLARVGIHGERGEETVELMLGLYAGHDLLHIRQIERIRAAVTG